MADRTVRVRLEAMTAAYLAAMRQASAVTTDFAKNIAGVGQAADKHLERVSRAALVAAGGLTVGLGLSARAAISWESSFAGVRKTVDGTAQDLSRLEGGLRDMATRLPATHGEIAAVAEAAGQLGVAVGDVEGFTEVMINLGETTDLTSDQAAVGIARITNIMGTAGRDVERFGSTLVDLGNSSAATESEILELTTRLAAAGQIAGLSESDVLAFAATLSSVGVEAEAGGTALSKVFTSVRDAVLEGGDALNTYAAVAGMSAQEFARAFERDAAGAITTFIEGLGRINESGQSTSAIFEELELTDQRLMRALLSTAGAGDLLRESIERGNEAWRDNTALQTEAEKRYETTAARLEVLRNQAVEVATGFGELMLPAINATVGGLGNMIEGFGEMPTVMQGAIVGTTGLVTGLTGVVGVVGFVGPKIRDLRESLRSMGTVGSALGNNLGKIGGVLAGVGAAVTVGALAYEAATRSARQYADAVAELGREMAGVIDGQQRLNDVIGDQVTQWAEGLDAETIEMLDRIGIKFDDIEQAITSGADALDPLRRKFEELGIEIPYDIDVGKIDDTGAALYRVSEQLGISRSQLEKLIDGLEDLDNISQDAARAQLVLFGAASKANQAIVDEAIAANTAEDGTINYAAAAADVGIETGAASSGVDSLTDSLLANMGSAETAADAIRDYVQAYRAGFDVLFAFQDAQQAVADHHDQVARAADAAADARQEAVRAANDVAEAERAVAEAMRLVVDEQEAARRGIDALAASQRSAIDPLFAVMDALQAQQDLLNPKKSTSREKKPGEATRTGSTAASGPSTLDAAQAAADVDAAFLRLAGAIRTGDVTLAQSQQMLQRWVQQGGITQAQADELAKKFAEAAAQAQALHGASIEQAAGHEIAAAYMEAEAERADRVRDAEERLRDAKDRLADAQDRAREAAEDHARAADGLERKVLDLWTASLELNGAIAANPALVQDAIAKLDEWVAQGLITEGQAARLRDRLQEAARAAQDLSGEYTVELTLDSQKFWLDLAAARFALAETQIAAQLGGARTAGPQVGDVEGTRHGGGRVSANGLYLVGRPGAEELFVPDQPGMIYSGGDTDRLLADWAQSGFARGTAGGSGGTVTTDNSQVIYQVAIPESVARRMDERELVGELGLLQWKRGRR